MTDAEFALVEDELNKMARAIDTLTMPMRNAPVVGWTRVKRGRVLKFTVTVDDQPSRGSK